VRLILGSSSPRRKELLAQIGITPDAILAPEIDETPQPRELPRPYCARMAREKAQAVASDPDDIVIAADTTVAMGRRIFGKPRDAGEAAEFLLQFSGRRHKVITAVAVKRGAKLWERLAVSDVKMKRLSDEELNWYLASGEWQGKAGAYGIHQRAGLFFPWIQGSFTGIVGLPVAETAQLLQAAGYPLFRAAP